MRIEKEKATIVIKRKVYCYLMEHFNRMPRSFRTWFSKKMYRPQIDKTASIAGLPIYLGKVNIGKYTFLNGDAYLENVNIGAYCSIGRDLRIISGNHDMSAFSTYPFWAFNKKSPFIKYKDSSNYEKFASGDEKYVSKLTNIGNDVWVGSFVSVLAGVNIATGAVVGAGSIVTKDVPPYAVVAGNPARIIRYRLPKERQERLLDSEWWNYTPEELARNWDVLNEM